MQKIQERLDAYLTQKGLKRTNQRKIITELFFGLPHRHYQIEEILEVSRKKDASISYATVYRTLMMLVDARLAIQRHFGKGPSQFEQITDHHHDHLICNHCGVIIEFENDAIEELQEKIAKQHGFKLMYHKMELYGLCRKCRGVSH